MDLLLRRRLMMLGGTPTPTPPGPPPSGYLECDWIASAGNCYIDTGIMPKADYSIEVVAKIYKYADTGWDTLWGTRDGSYSRYTWHDNNKSTQINIQRSTNAGLAHENVNYNINRTDRLTWKTYGFYKNLAKIDGTIINTFSEATGSDSFPNSIYLFALHNSTNGVTDYGYYYVKACKIWDENDNLLRDYIPVYEIATSKFGLWDKIGRTFSPSASANEFAGNLRDITLPTGYTQVDFVRFTGTQRILFTETVKYTDCFEADFKFNNLTKQQRVFSVDNRQTDLYINSSTQIAFNWGASRNSVSTAIPADLGHSYFKDDGYAGNIFLDCHATTKTMSFSSYTPFEDKSAWYIGEYGDASNPWPQMDLYRFKKYENNVLVRDLIPCINSSEVYGLYDIVKNEFRGSTEAAALQGGFIKD